MTRSTTIRDKHRHIIAKGKPPCYLCDGEIEYDAHHLHPLSFTVDHIIPLNRGGLDVLANKAAAHRRCNRTKSDRVLVPLLVTTRTWVA